MKYEKAMQMAADLHRVAEFIGMHFTQLPDIDVEVTSYVGFGWAASKVDDVPATVADAVLAGLSEGAAVRKEYGGSYFRAYVEFGDLEYKVVCERDAVCTRRVIGTQMVTKQVPPEGQWTEREVEEDIVEWDCHPLLAANREVTDGG